MVGNNSRSETFELYTDLFEDIRKKLKNPRADMLGSAVDLDDPDDPVAAKARKWGELSKENTPGYSFYHYMYTPEQMKRRIRTAVRYEQTACEKLKYKGGVKGFRFGWMSMAPLPLKGGYDSTDRFSDVVMAAAIWILDELTLKEKMDELYPFIEDACEYDCSDFIRCFHPSYDPDLISAVINTIRHRNDDLYEHDQFQHNWADPWTTSVVRDVSVQSRKRENFEGMMALLDGESVKKAMRRYEEKVWDFYRIAFYIDDALEKRLKRYDFDIAAAEKKLNEATRDQLKKQFEIEMVPVLSPLMMPDPEEAYVPQNGEIRRLQGELNRLNRERREHEAKLIAAFSSMAFENEREKCAWAWKGLVPDELLEELVRFSVDDPYESAFALLALLDSNSDIPWLYYGSVAVFYTLIDQLPMTHSMYLYKGIPEEHITDGETLPEYRMIYPSEHRFDQGTDAEGEKIVRDRAENLAQKIFARTYTLLPRIRRDLNDTDLLMKEIGAETEREKEAYELLMQVLWSCLDDEHGLQEYRLLSEKAGEPEEEEEKNPDEAENREIAELKHRIAALSREYREEAVRIRDLQNERDEMAREMEDMRRELGELRNVVFNRENTEAEEAPEAPGISLPYETKRRVVSFGGHPGWLKSMKEYLPGVRFISPDMLANTMLLRAADVVWIQTNCISHSDYYRIMNVVREKGIPVHYYAYESAMKCAQQLAAEDSAD